MLMVIAFCLTPLILDAFLVTVLCAILRDNIDEYFALGTPHTHFIQDQHLESALNLEYRNTNMAAFIPTCATPKRWEMASFLFR